MSKISLVQGDITRQQADAVVNAANPTLLGGGGVDGAIHRAAGPELLEACKKLNGCRVGEAKVTPGFHLPAKYVIHTVGPIWQGGDKNEDELLASCYRNSLKLALEKNARSVAFPAISTGVYSFPQERAAQIAVREVKAFLDKHSVPEEVVFVSFDERTYQIYFNIIE